MGLLGLRTCGLWLVALPQLSFGHATAVLRTCHSRLPEGQAAYPYTTTKTPLQYTMAAATDYTVVYGVGLLDDIHNYFPALLYDSGRFQNTTQIFHYVRHQLNERFNLFSYGASLYTASAPASNNSVPTTPTTPATPAPARLLRSDTARGADSLTSATTLQTMTALLGLLRLPEDIDMDFRIPRMTPMRRTAQAWSFSDPIVVRPSAQVIATATERVDGSSLAENTGCAICQDTISNTESARRLRACGHVYHTGCIDEWFHRSVFCPACRHDIREPLAASASAPAPAPAQAPTEVEQPSEETHSYFQ